MVKGRIVLGVSSMAVRESTVGINPAAKLFAGGIRVGCNG